MLYSEQKKIWTIPNILSIIRIILILPFIYYFMKENYAMAVLVISISGLSDCFDGLIARKFNQISELGMLLDPLADKLTLAAVIICVSIKIPIMIPTTIILLIKELLMLIGGIILINKKITVPPAKWYGKVATILFYAVTIVIVYLQTVLNYENIILMGILLLITTAVMLCALLFYIRIFFELINNEKVESHHVNTKGAQ